MGAVGVMQFSITRCLLAATLASLVFATLALGAHSRISPGCNTRRCAREQCQKHPRCQARVEARLARAARASSTPVAVSWYGPGLYGNRLGCGGTLTPSSVGVANKSLPCGSSVTLCFRGCTTVPVIDRGPYVAGRTFDLTAPVWRAIGQPSVSATVRWVTSS